VIAHANDTRSWAISPRLVAGSGCPSDNEVGPRRRWSWPAPPFVVYPGVEHGKVLYGRCGHVRVPRDDIPAGGWPSGGEPRKRIRSLPDGPRSARGRGQGREALSRKPRQSHRNQPQTKSACSQVSGGIACSAGRSESCRAESTRASPKTSAAAGIRGVRVHGLRRRRDHHAERLPRCRPGRDVTRAGAAVDRGEPAGSRVQPR
jgi:hypothetical protein